MAFSEIIRFVLPPHRLSDFIKLREYVSSHGRVTNQYFGGIFAPIRAALPFKQDEICWVIQWPQDSEIRTDVAFRTRLNGLTEDGDAKSLLFHFEDRQISEMTKALEAPISEFAIINLRPDAPRSDTNFTHSMHKTYSDCYLMDKFVGGEWSYALNTNDTSGVLVDGTKHPSVAKEDRRLACYYLGWESVAAHQAASKTEIFAEEMVKLVPWFGPGSGAWYVEFEKHA